MRQKTRGIITMLLCASLTLTGCSNTTGSQKKEVKKENCRKDFSAAWAKGTFCSYRAVCSARRGRGSGNRSDPRLRKYGRGRTPRVSNSLAGCARPERKRPRGRKGTTHILKTPCYPPIRSVRGYSANRIILPHEVQPWVNKTSTIVDVRLSNGGRPRGFAPNPT